MQLIFVLWIVYLLTALPSVLDPTSPMTAFEGGAPPATFLGFLQPFGQMVFNTFTGNWGLTGAPGTGGRVLVPETQLYAYLIPESVQLALFALPTAAALAYPVSLIAGWSRRAAAETPAQMTTLGAALLPVFLLALLASGALFFYFLHQFNDVPGQGLMPSPTWFLFHGTPSWILYGSVSQPTGMPLVDSVIHEDWTIAAISFTKTLLQAMVIAVAYLAVFFRHARGAVRSVRDEPYMTGARARGVPERTLLWRHAARRVRPSFLLIFALTVPEYLLVQFAVETAFTDVAGLGYQTIEGVAEGIVDPVLVFLIALFVLSWILVVDVLAEKLVPAGASER